MNKGINQMEKFQKTYNSLSMALESAAIVANRDNVTCYVYKHDFYNKAFQVTNFVLNQEKVGWIEHLKVYPYEPSEMTIKEKGL